MVCVLSVRLYTHCVHVHVWWYSHRDCAIRALDDVKKFLLVDGGQVAVSQCQHTRVHVHVHAVWLCFTYQLDADLCTTLWSFSAHSVHVLWQLQTCFDISCTHYLPVLLSLLDLWCYQHYPRPETAHSGCTHSSIHKGTCTYNV